MVLNAGEWPEMSFGLYNLTVHLCFEHGFYQLVSQRAPSKHADGRVCGRQRMWAAGGVPMQRCVMWPSARCVEGSGATFSKHQIPAVGFCSRPWWKQLNSKFPPSPRCGMTPNPNHGLRQASNRSVVQDAASPSQSCGLDVMTELIRAAPMVPWPTSS